MDNKKAFVICEIGRHSYDNAIILYGIEEGCSKEDFIRIMRAANNEERVFVTIESPKFRCPACDHTDSCPGMKECEGTQNEIISG